MPSTIQLDHELVTFEEARSRDFNVIHRYNQVALVQELYGLLWSEKDAIAATVQAQLGQKEARCSVTSPREWIRGKFNICIPIEVKSRLFEGKLIMRCPMPSALAESQYPGTITEKLRSEIGAYVWMQQNCQDIRIPRLLGFSILDRHISYHGINDFRESFYESFGRFFDVPLDRNIFRHQYLHSYQVSICC
ncbi:hypothetical protein AAL_04097 [Moelleriella libera RCEF 2490]|uniref:Uncharacterized protein n=1 Tax=Moelleriella libera RCEF 2490 TaxID=1081109 RepID=A0A168CPV6_9HYPO|nr:hypothetical protein AAL_04097 [Moelleriella libera RCEF 2490]